MGKSTVNLVAETKSFLFKSRLKYQYIFYYMIIMFGEKKLYPEAKRLPTKHKCTNQAVTLTKEIPYRKFTLIHNQYINNIPTCSH